MFCRASGSYEMGTKIPEANARMKKDRLMMEAAPVGLTRLPIAKPKGIEHNTDDTIGADGGERINLPADPCLQRIPHHSAQSTQQAVEDERQYDRRCQETGGCATGAAILPALDVRASALEVQLM